MFQQPLLLVTTGVIHIFFYPHRGETLTTTNLVNGVTCWPKAIIFCYPQIGHSLTLAGDTCITHTTTIQPPPRAGLGDWASRCGGRKEKDMGNPERTWQKRGGGFLGRTMERHFWSKTLQSWSSFPTLSQVITLISFMKVAGGFTSICEVP